MPVFQHRRLDTYARARARPTHDGGDLLFSDKTIPAGTIFYRTPLSFGFTNIRCVVAGHVLVCSRRIVPKVTQLHAHEIADLFCAAVHVQRTMERLHDVGSSTLVVQDGPDAGRTVPHVHVHVLPRRPGDFDHNDDVYAALAQHDTSPETFPARQLDDMVAEAMLIRVAIHARADSNH